MNVQVLIPTPLRRHTAGVDHIRCAASDLNELLAALESNFPDLKPHLRDESGRVRRFLNIYVNEEDIRFLGADTYRFQEGDEVMLVPSIAGGSRSEPRVVTREDLAVDGFTRDVLSGAIWRAAKGECRWRILPRGRAEAALASIIRQNP